MYLRYMNIQDTSIAGNLPLIKSEKMQFPKNSNGIIAQVFKRLWPGYCILCRTASHTARDLCLECEALLPRIFRGCHSCAIPLPVESQKDYCGDCLQSVLIFHQARALFVYSCPIDQLIMDLKFNYQLVVAKVLGELMADKMQESYGSSLPNVIMPIPLHLQRLRERGFNQALELARPISLALGVPLDYHSCRRPKATDPQTGLSAKVRAQNMRRAFTVHKDLTGQTICLIDDVMTTGHTVNAASRALMKQGATKIDVWCCARVLGIV